ncbi:MAG: exosortase C-terminal domain/associated protein EpsI [Alphaproteobacteria bacterium]
MKTELLQPATIAPSARVTLLLQGVLIATAFGLLYGPLVPGLVNDWYTYSPYSYGFLVPVIAGYLAWQKRERLKTLPVSPSYWGLLTLAAAVLLLLMGRVIADSFVMRVSMVLAIPALVQATLGNRFLKELGFPICYLALMIPVPYVIVNKIVNYLMFFDARHSATVLQLIGVPVYLDSNFLHLPNITLEVADVCSGISSVFALFVLGVLYAYCLPLGARLKILLVASTVPLAVVGNIFRIIVTVALTYYVGPVVLRSTFHKFNGTFNFLLSFALFITIVEVLRKKLAASPDQPDNIAGPLATAYKSRVLKREGWNAAVISTLVMTAAIWTSATLEKPSNSPASVNFANAPSVFGAFPAAEKPWPDAYHDIKAEQSATRYYATAAGIPVEFFLGYRGDGSRGARLQSPKLILPPKWSYLWVKPTELNVGNSEKIEANWMLTQMDNSRRLVLYWYEYEGGTFSGELYYRFALLKDRLRNRPGGMIVVRIATPVLGDESIRSAQDRLRNFAILAHSESRRLLGKR